MKLNHTVSFLGLACGTFIALATSAQAANFTTNVQKTDAKSDIWLQSVTQNGVTINKFNLINEAKGNILFNDTIKLSGKDGETANPNAGGYNNNTGAASTDRGDNASKPNGLEVSGVKDPTMPEIATYLGNQNMNNIIDTEDDGAFEMNLFFTYMLQQDNKGLDNVFIWERGKNSDIVVQAIDEKGDIIGNYLKLNRGDQASAGYQIDTLEIGGAQNVGSWGVSLSQLGVASAAGIRIKTENAFDGPDFKIMARLNDNPVLRKQAPEPATMIGLGVIASSLAVSRRRKLSKAC
ncbi:MAG TPA: exosortase-dependent surface protein XDP2 [Leptolyngbyaceae cyanobacterium]